MASQQTEKKPSELLLVLSASCQRHKDQVHKDPKTPVDQRQIQGAIPSKCQSDLATLRQLLPKVEDEYSPEKNPHPSDVLNLCDFYLSVVSGSFCPHFKRLFHCQENRNEILPRVHFLLKFIVSKPIGQNLVKAFEHDAPPVVEKICSTIAHLLHSIPCADAIVLEDLVMLSSDLAVLAKGRTLENMKARVLIFPRTCESWSLRQTLELGSVDALIALQGALPMIIGHTRALCFRGRNAFSDLIVPPSISRQTHDPATKQVGRLLASCRQILLERARHLKRQRILQVYAKINASKMIAEIAKDWQKLGAPYLPELCVLVTTVVSTFLMKDSGQDQIVEHRMLLLEADMSRLLVEIFLSPPTTVGFSEREVLAILGSSCLPRLFDVIGSPGEPLNTSQQGTATLQSLLFVINFILSLDCGDGIVLLAYEYCEGNGVFGDFQNLLSRVEFCFQAVSILCKILSTRRMCEGRSELDAAIQLVCKHSQAPSQPVPNDALEQRRSSKRTAPNDTFTITTTPKRRRSFIGDYAGQSFSSGKRDVQVATGRQKSLLELLVNIILHFWRSTGSDRLSPRDFCLLCSVVTMITLETSVSGALVESLLGKLIGTLHSDLSSVIERGELSAAHKYLVSHIVLCCRSRIPRHQDARMVGVVWDLCVSVQRFAWTDLFDVRNPKKRGGDQEPFHGHQISSLFLRLRKKYRSSLIPLRECSSQRLVFLLLSVDLGKKWATVALLQSKYNVELLTSNQISALRKENVGVYSSVFELQDSAKGLDDARILMIAQSPIVIVPLLRSVFIHSISNDASKPQHATEIFNDFPVGKLISLATMSKDWRVREAALLASRKIIDLGVILSTQSNCLEMLDTALLFDPHIQTDSSREKSFLSAGPFQEIFSSSCHLPDNKGFREKRALWAYLFAILERSGVNEDPIPSTRSGKTGCGLWVFSAPFSERSHRLRLLASNKVGRLLCGRSMFAKYLFGGGGGAIAKWLSGDASDLELVEHLFREVDVFLHKYCFVSQSQLSYTVRLTSVSLKTKPKQSDDIVRAKYQLSAIRTLSSLCRAADTNSRFGQMVHELSVVRLVRFWALLYQKDDSDSCCEVCIPALAFRYIRSVSLRSQSLLVVGKRRIETFAPSLFSDMLLPAVNSVLHESNTCSSFVREQQFRLLAVFTASFLVDLPFFKKNAVCVLRRSLQGYDSAGVLDAVIQQVDHCLRFVFTTFILEKDYDSLRIATAFKLFLLSQRRNLDRSRDCTSREIVGASIHRATQRSAYKTRRLDLEEHTLNLCLSPEKIEHVLPRILMYHEDRSQLVFFLQTVLLKRISLSDILNKRDELILKAIVWELGSEDTCIRATDTLKTAAIAKQDLGDAPNAKSIPEDAAQEAAQSWITTNFMYLVVNVVQYRWNHRDINERIRALRCLNVILGFLAPPKAHLFVAPVIATVDVALGTSETDVTDFRRSLLRLLAVQSLSRYAQILIDGNIEVAGEYMTTMVVALFPVLTKGNDIIGHYDHEAEKTAVELLMSLTSGSKGKRLATFFKDIPFLPETRALERVRENLRAHQVDFDGDLLQSPTQQLNSSKSDAGSSITESSVVVNDSLITGMLKRMRVLCPLLSHESGKVRKAVLEHMTELFNCHRSLLCHMFHFNRQHHMSNSLTVKYREDKEESVLSLTKVVEILLRMAAHENDQACQLALAKCFGELGAIDERRLGSIHNNEPAVSTTSRNWMLAQPPWHSTVARYELHILTNHLVRSLRAATTSVDQHKIAFSIQEVLRDLDGVVRTGSSNEKSGPTNREAAKERNAMSQWLRDKLEQAGVLDAIETFWHSKFNELESFTPRQPPFFTTSSSFFSWISHWCRYMIDRSRVGGRTGWQRLFFCCRTAIRSSAGVEVAEFILPVLVLDRLCYGDTGDEETVWEEMTSVLKAWKGSSMLSKNDLNKSVGVVFAVLEILEGWAEGEVEEQHCKKRSGRVGRQKSNGGPTSWSAESCVDRIGDLLKRVPLSLRASAAMASGMHAHSLRYLELDARSSGFGRSFDSMKKVSTGFVPGETLLSRHVHGIDELLFKNVLEGLGDFETLRGFDIIRDSGQRLESIKERESCGDWMGAWSLSERELQFTSDERQVNKLLNVGLKCLLRLGQYETVLKQVRGVGNQRGCGEITPETNHAGDYHCVLHYAIEAAWQLGKWERLANIVDSKPPLHKHNDFEGAFRAAIGKALLGLYCKSETDARLAIEHGRKSIMEALPILASRGYSAAYPALVRLQSLQDVEDVLNHMMGSSEDNTSANFSDKANEKSHQGWAWDSRLELASKADSWCIVDVRLGLARVFNDSLMEGTLFLTEAKWARKRGMSQMSANALAKAEAKLKDISGRQKGTCLANTIDETLGELKVQLAKMERLSGRTGNALKLLGDLDVRDWGRRDRSVMLSLVEERIGGERAGNVEHFAKRLLLSTEWIAQSELKGFSEILERYRVATTVAPELEKGHFQFARYVDSILTSRIYSHVGRGSNMVDQSAHRQAFLSEDTVSQEYIVLTVEQYLQALKLDTKHVYHSLPRLLSLWFELTSIHTGRSSSTKRSISNELKERLKNRQRHLNSCVSQHIKAVIAEAYYTALPQLISRVTHRNNETAMIVETILTRVLTKFPSQAMWNLAWLRNSVNSQRLKIGDRIFKSAQESLVKRRDRRHQSLLATSNSLVRFLIDLAKFSPKDPNARHFSVASWRADVALSEFIPPIQAALAAPFGWQGRPVEEHFPRMRTFCSQVGVMSSKARPKKLRAFVVSPGKVKGIQENSPKQSQRGDLGELHFLVKNEAKGDLRKDARVQDLNTVINRLIASSEKIENDRRPQFLRTFAVTCLSEDCGILEWVPNTESFRSLVSKTYNPQASTFSTMRSGRRLTNITDATLRQSYDACQNKFFKTGDLTGAAKMFAEMCTNTYPSLFYWWFIQSFSDPHAWYNARTNFTSSAALWSAVGHVIGLGDRHSENLLIDTSTGNCVHVDFDCIFDKGLALPKPEVVPFRLTPNMLDAFGPVGADGIYSGSLQSAMNTLRQNRETLLSVLEPFLNDPIIDWKRSRSQQKQASNKSASCRDTIEAQRSLKVIDDRLRGVVNQRNPNFRKIKRTDEVIGEDDEDVGRLAPLSVEGQVHKVIAEATRYENLVQLYIGWMPWI